MTKEQAIAEFFQYNQIDPAQISRYLDPKLEYLSEKVDQWLAIVDPSDRELFLRLLSRYTYLTNEASVRRYHEGIHILTDTLQSLGLSLCDLLFITTETSVYKGYKRDKIEMRVDRVEVSDFPLYLNAVAGRSDCQNQNVSGFSFVVEINAVPVIKIIRQLFDLLGRYGFNAQLGDCL